MTVYSKDSKRIELRGKLDTLNSLIILLQAASCSQEYITDLEEVRAVVNRLQRCEAGEKIFDEGLMLWGVDGEELHRQSHNPAKFFGKGHILPHHEMGRKAAELNFLRTAIRETELCAVRAFGNDDNLRIGHVLNRLSSAVYVLTYKYLPEDYRREIRFGSS